MSESQTAVKTFDVLPMGICLACLDSMTDPARGLVAIFRDLGGGRSIWAVYCVHTRCGAYTFVGQRSEPQWTLHTPIGILEFTALVEKAAAFVVGPSAAENIH